MSRAAKARILPRAAAAAGTVEAKGTCDIRKRADRETLSTKDAAKRLGVSVRALRRALQAGDLPAVRINRRWRVLRLPLEKLLLGESDLANPSHQDVGQAKNDG